MSSCSQLHAPRGQAGSWKSTLAGIFVDGNGPGWASRSRWLGSDQHTAAVFSPGTPTRSLLGLVTRTRIDTQNKGDLLPRDFLPPPAWGKSWQPFLRRRRRRKEGREGGRNMFKMPGFNPT